MGDATKGWTLGEIASVTGCGLHGPADLLIRRPVPAGDPCEEGITFATSASFLELALSGPVGAVICGSVPEGQEGRAFLVSDDPRRAFGTVLGMFERRLPFAPGIHATAVMEGATLGEGVAIGAYSVVCDGAEIGDGAVVHPFCFVGPRCVVGAGTVLQPRVTLVQDVILGRGCLVHSGAVLGADGFGFAWDGTRQAKIPQVGAVTIGDNVEIGANCTIDRATCGSTLVRDGVKLDDMVHIGHNSVVGDHTVIAAQTGLSGSVTVGRQVMMGGQSGVADHVRVVDKALIGARCAVFSDIDEPGDYLGGPAMRAKAFIRMSALMRRLPEFFDRLKKVEARVGEGDSE